MGAFVLVMTNFIMNVAAIACDSKQFTSGKRFKYGMVLSVERLVVLDLAKVTIWPLLGMPILVNP